MDFFRSTFFTPFFPRGQGGALWKKALGLGGGIKLAAALALAVCAVAGSAPVFPAAVLIFTLALAFAFAGPGGLRILRPVLPLVPWMALIIALQALFGSRDMAALARYAPALFARAAALVSLVSLLAALTPARQIQSALRSFLSLFAPLGLPAADISLAAGIALRFVPVLREEARRIAAAQLSRGGKKSRVFLLVPMIVPLILRSLERSRNLASAMQLRLYLNRSFD